MTSITEDQRERLMTLLEKASDSCLDARGMMDDLKRANVQITLGDWPVPMREAIDVLKFKLTDALMSANFVKDALAPRNVPVRSNG